MRTALNDAMRPEDIVNPRYRSPVWPWVRFALSWVALTAFVGLMVATIYALMLAPVFSHE